MILISKDTEVPRKVTVEINCDVLRVCYSSKKNPNYKTLGIYGCYLEVFGFSKINSINVYDDNDEICIDEEDVQYSVTNDFFHKLFNDDEPLPVEARSGIYDDYDVEYEIEVTGEFDPNKLKLIKSNECLELPDFILAGKIIYDNAEYNLSHSSENDIYMIDVFCDNMFDIEELCD